jgi:hypothetical protein
VFGVLIAVLHLYQIASRARFACESDVRIVLAPSVSGNVAPRIRPWGMPRSCRGRHPIGLTPSRLPSRNLSMPGFGQVKVTLTFDPPWDKDRMSDEAKLTLNMF